ncbi:unnamed protein product, partial [Amoebophrya sp. A120]
RILGKFVTDKRWASLPVEFDFSPGTPLPEGVSFRDSSATFKRYGLPTSRESAITAAKRLRKDIARLEDNLRTKLVIVATDSGEGQAKASEVEEEQEDQPADAAAAQAGFRGAGLPPKAAATAGGPAAGPPAKIPDVASVIIS